MVLPDIFKESLKGAGSVNEAEQLGNLPALYVLIPDSYNQLVSEKEQVLHELEAMKTIVATANMNPRVLLRELRLQKRKIIARMDATPYGKQFLKSLIEEEPEENHSIILSRLRTSNLLTLKRQEMNRKLLRAQQDYLPPGIDQVVTIILLRGLLKKEALILQNSLIAFEPKSKEESEDKLILSCLLDDVVTLRNRLVDGLKSSD